MKKRFSGNLGIFFIMLLSTLLATTSGNAKLISGDNDNQITLRWDANDPAPDGYNIYGRLTGQSYTYNEEEWSGPATTAIVFCPENPIDGSYDCYYVARAETAGNSSADSNEIRYYVAPPITDRDGDNVPDDVDAFPDDPTEWFDTDLDGIGNNADTDDDGDGVPDTEDWNPVDASEQYDTDGDGIGNNADTDDDGDGVADTVDAFPLNASESIDTDLDGIGNNADTDDDGDGFSDSYETSYGTGSLETDDFPLVERVFYSLGDTTYWRAFPGASKYKISLGQSADNLFYTMDVGNVETKFLGFPDGWFLCVKAFDAVNNMIGKTVTVSTSGEDVPPEPENPVYADGILTFDLVYELVNYRAYLSYDDGVTWVSPIDFTGNTLDIDGDVTVIVCAMNGSTEGEFFEPLYLEPSTQSNTVTNVTVVNSLISWDPFPGASSYHLMLKMGSYTYHYDTSVTSVQWGAGWTVEIAPVVGGIIGEYTTPIDT